MIKPRPLLLTYIFAIMLLIHPLTARAQTPTFTDVPNDSWAAGAIESAAKNGLMAGMGNGIFG